MTPEHEERCAYADRTPLSAQRRGCRCPEVGQAVRRHKRDWAAERKALAAKAKARGGRPDDDVDDLDVEAAIVSYAARRKPVPATLTTAERFRVAEWLDRYRRTNHAPDITLVEIGRITDLGERAIRKRFGVASQCIDA